MKGDKVLGYRYAHVKSRKYHAVMVGHRFVLCGCASFFSLPNDYHRTGFNRSTVKSNARARVRWR